jgi:DNA polymerase/3'-5' exonuclease PolX
MPDKVRRPREELRAAVDQLEIFGLTVAGSWRRVKPDIGDLDVLVPISLTFPVVLDEARVWFGYEEIRGGEKKSEGICDDYRGKPLNLNFWKCPSKEAWAALLLYATGPYDLNIMMRAKAKGRLLTLNQYGLHNSEGKQVDDGELEEQIFSLLEIPYLLPAEREHWRDKLLTRPKVNHVQVWSSKGDTKYDVTLNPQGVAQTCECKGFTYRGKCRHLTEAEEIFNEQHAG